MFVEVRIPKAGAGSNVPSACIAVTLIPTIVYTKRLLAYRAAQ